MVENPTHPVVPADAAERVASPTVRRIVGPTILLNSGNYFDFLAPETSEFTINDVAHSLSQICRFGGHSRTFYSVAQHSVLVSHYVSPQNAYAGLMHDAVEAFIGDMTKPLKDLVPEYRAIEKRIEAVVLSRFDVPTPMPAEVKKIDVVMLATEQRQLMHNRDDWNYTRGRQPLDITISTMPPEQAKALFLFRFNEIRPTHIAPAPILATRQQDAAGTMAEAERLVDDLEMATEARIKGAGREYASLVRAALLNAVRALLAENTRLRSEREVPADLVARELSNIERQVKITCELDRNETNAKQCSPVPTTVEISLSHILESTARLRAQIAAQQEPKP